MIIYMIEITLQYFSRLKIKHFTGPKYKTSRKYNMKIERKSYVKRTDSILFSSFNIKQIWIILYQFGPWNKWIFFSFTLLENSNDNNW